MSTSTQSILNNGTVLTVSGIIKHIMSSAAKAKVAGLFINAKEGEIPCTTLDEMGYPQEATPIQTNNSTDSGITNNIMNQQHHSCSIHMQFCWVCAKVQQGHFKDFWAPSRTNPADHFTKHHPTKHHQRGFRPIYLHQPKSTTTLLAIVSSII
jgi:hypothetical protein